MKKRLFLLTMMSVFCFSACGQSEKTNTETQARTQTEVQKVTEVQTESKIQNDTTAPINTEAETQVQTDSETESYTEIWKEFLQSGSYQEYTDEWTELEYTIYDINQDGKEELLIESAQDLPFFNTWVFVYDNRIVKLSPGKSISASAFRNQWGTLLGSISILISLLGVTGTLNHILNTGERLLQPICITILGAAAAWISFRKRGDSV